MKEIIQFIYEQVKVRPKITITALVTAALLIGYQQYEINAQQEECLERQKDKIVNIEKTLAVQEKVSEQITEARKEQREEIRDLDKKLDLIIGELLKD